MTLHILSCRPEQHEALENCLRAACAGDQLLLIGEGVYNAICPPAHLTCYAINEDIQKHQLIDKIDRSVTIIDYDKFVQLACQCKPVCSWF